MAPLRASGDLLLPSKTAFHGLTRLSPEELANAYPDPVDFVGLQTYRWWVCSSQFEIPYIYIAQYLIPEIDASRLVYPLRADFSVDDARPGVAHAPSSAPSLESLYDPRTDSILTSLVTSPYYQLIDDLHDTIDFNFGNFEDGYYFEAFHKPDLSDLVFSRLDLIPFLQEARSAGVKLFLMTNSNHHYTGALMNFAFGTAWRELFDLVIYRARKPHFFLFDAPFQSIVDASLPGEVDGLKTVPSDEKLQLGKEYYGGNLKKLTTDLLGSAPVVYAGDELFGDVVAPTVYAGWKTIAILEELQEVEEKDGWKSPAHERRNLNSPIPKLESTAANLALDRWGNYFYCEDGTLTYYGALMHHFAEIAVPCVSRLAHFDLNQPILPHHPNSQLHATRPAEQKQRVTCYITEKAARELPPNFVVPGIELMTRNRDLARRLRDLRIQYVSPIGSPMITPSPSPSPGLTTSSRASPFSTNATITPEPSMTPEPSLTPETTLTPQPIRAPPSIIISQPVSEGATTNSK